MRSRFNNALPTPAPYIVHAPPHDQRDIPNLQAHHKKPRYVVSLRRRQPWWTDAIDSSPKNPEVGQMASPQFQPATVYACANHYASFGPVSHESLPVHPRSAPFYCETRRRPLVNQNEIENMTQGKGRPDGPTTPLPGPVQLAAAECAASSTDGMRRRFSVNGSHPGTTKGISGLPQQTDIKIADMARRSFTKFGGTSARVDVGPRTALPPTPDCIEIGRFATHDVSAPPSWGSAADTSAAAVNLASTDGPSAEPRWEIQQHGVQSLSCSNAQLPGYLRYSGGSRAGTSWEISAGTVGGTGYPLSPNDSQRSHILASTSYALDASHQLYEHKQPWLRVPSDSVGGTGSSLEERHLLHPELDAFSQGQIPTWTSGIAPKSCGVLREAPTEIGRSSSTHARLEKPIQPYLPAFTLSSDAASFHSHTRATKAETVDVAVQTDGHPSSPKNKRPIAGVQRTEQHRHGKLAKTPLYLQRKKHISRESNVAALQERCRRQRGDDEAIGYLSVILEEGVTAKALNRKITKTEIAKQIFGPSTEPRQVYWALLDKQIKDGFIRYVCRLCAKEKRYPYMNAKDIVPHIWRCHIGIEGETGEFGRFSIAGHISQLTFSRLRVTSKRRCGPWAE
jgi:hypothetical protein